MVPTLVTSVAAAFTGFVITRSRRLKWAPISGAAFFIVGCVSLSLLKRGLPEAVYELVLVPHAVGQGLQFPGSIMALLASSRQREQAVVTGTLLLWRNLGMVLGVAYSSLVVQNALVYYLDIFIDNRPDKAEIMQAVRRDVGLVAELEGPVREQVVQGYEAAIRLTFMTCCVGALISLCVLAPIKLKRLPKKT